MQSHTSFIITLFSTKLSHRF